MVNRRQVQRLLAERVDLRPDAQPHHLVDEAAGRRAGEDGERITRGKECHTAALVELIKPPSSVPEGCLDQPSATLFSLDIKMGSFQFTYEGCIDLTNWVVLQGRGNPPKGATNWTDHATQLQKREHQKWLHPTPSKNALILHSKIGWECPGYL